MNYKEPANATAASGSMAEFQSTLPIDLTPIKKTERTALDCQVKKNLHHSEIPLVMVEVSLSFFSISQICNQYTRTQCRGKKLQWTLWISWHLYCLSTLLPNNRRPWTYPSTLNKTGQVVDCSLHSSVDPRRSGGVGEYSYGHRRGSMIKSQEN